MDNNFSSISEIAYQSGFNNVASFNRAFKTLMKKSPRAFMKEYQTETESA
jgi:AraC-like DNA-binding protein